MDLCKLFEAAKFNRNQVRIDKLYWLVVLLGPVCNLFNFSSWHIWKLVNHEFDFRYHLLAFSPGYSFFLELSDGALSILPKIPEILVRNQMEQTISVRSDRNIWDHLWRSVGPKVPFHLTKLLFLVPLFCILLTRRITKRAVAWVGSVQPECTISLGTWNFRNFELEFSLNWSPRAFQNRLVKPNIK